MSKFNVFQQNNLKVGNYLAAEIPASSTELRAFVVINAYIQNPLGLTKPSKFLNNEQDNQLLFRFHKYELEKHLVECTDEISRTNVKNEILQKNIQTIESLEHILEKYLQDFSLLKVAWNFDPPLPFL